MMAHPEPREDGSGLCMIKNFWQKLLVLGANIVSVDLFCDVEKLGSVILVSQINSRLICCSAIYVNFFRNLP